MKVDRFSVFIILRVLFIVGLSIIFGLIVGKPEYFFSQVIIGTLILLVTVELIFFNRKAVREINRFLFALKNDDLTVNFPDKGYGPLYNELSVALRDYITMFRDRSIQNEARYRLLHSIIDHIDFGILAINPKGEFLLANETFQRLFRLNRTSNLDILNKIQPDLVKELNNMQSGTRKLVDVSDQKDMLQLIVYKRTLSVGGKDCELITFNDIRNEIEQKEIEAWFKLIRILTHEIMNSVTPLASLTDTILMLLRGDEHGARKAAELSDRNIGDVIEATQMIRNRSKWILKFVEDYRKLTNIPALEFREMKASLLFDSVVKLMQDMLSKNGIRLMIQNEHDPVIKIDAAQMELVLVNLISNSMYAVSGQQNPEIVLTADTNDGKSILQVADNGCGIPADRIDKIFIPFYSTRDGGSGIGLSFSKQVVYRHHGRLMVSSEEGEGTSFSIILPAVKH